MQADERPSIVVKHEPNLSQENEIPAEQREAYATNTLQHRLLKQQQQQGGAQQIILMQPPSSIHPHNIINSALAVQANNGASSSMVAAEGQDYGAGASYVNLPTIAAATTSNVMESEYEEMNMRDKEELREQDRFLPIANVARIMKKAIPDSGKIAKDAKECVQECLSEFISFITSEASERCQQEKRKTINGEDILFAMTTLGFDNYVDPLKIYLAKYRESMKGEKLLTMGDYGAVEAIEDSSINHSLQYQVGDNTIHATMVNGAYSQNKVLELQNLHPNLHFST